MTIDELRELARERIIRCSATDVLDEAQLAALGRVTAEWGMLEAALNRHIDETLKLPVSFQLLTGNAAAVALTPRLIKAAPNMFPNEPRQLIDELTSCLREIERLAPKRNELLHAMWGVITEAMGLSGGIPAQYGTVYRKHGAAMSHFPAEAPAIEQVAVEIADARLKLNRIFYLILLLRQNPEMLGKEGL